MIDPQVLQSFICSDLPPTGGSIKTQDQDFEVEEIPAYEPCGSGDHLYLWIEKRGVSADHLVRHIARCLEIRPGDIGCAGLKDTRAVTRQYISVPKEAQPRIDTITTEDILVVKTNYHTNKLKTGHLRGNRFRVVIRNPVEDAAVKAQAIKSRLITLGVPNFFGPQRFGIDGQTFAAGMQLLLGQKSELLSRAPPARRGFLRRLALSSVQSGLFNRCLANRMADGLLHQVILGEVMQVCASGGPFVAEDVVCEQERFNKREIVPAGPMFGPKMRSAKEPAILREQAVLAESGLSAADFARHGKLLLGTRRANIFWPREFEVESHSSHLELRFVLPKGSYATVLLNEFTRSQAAADSSLPDLDNE